MAVLRKPISPLIGFEPLAGSQGLERLVRSGLAQRFFQIANHFRIQIDRFSCGATSASIVLNVLRYNTDRAPESGPGIRAYTPENVFNEKSDTIKPRRLVFAEHTAGLELEELRRILVEAHSLDVEKWVAGEAERSVLSERLIDALQDPAQYVIANFARENSGHFSPVVAFDRLSHSVLILDTNPSQSPWNWVGLESLCDAMETPDNKENRGFLVIAEGP